MTPHDPQPAPLTLTPDDLDAVVAGETRPTPSAPAPAQTSGMAYATLTVGGSPGLYR